MNNWLNNNKTIIELQFDSELTTLTHSSQHKSASLNTINNDNEDLISPSICEESGVINLNHKIHIMHGTPNIAKNHHLQLSTTLEDFHSNSTSVIDKNILNVEALGMDIPGIKYIDKNILKKLIMNEYNQQFAKGTNKVTSTDDRFKHDYSINQCQGSLFHSKNYSSKNDSFVSDFLVLTKTIDPYYR